MALRGNEATRYRGRGRKPGSIRFRRVSQYGGTGDARRHDKRAQATMTGAALIKTVKCSIQYAIHTTQCGVQRRQRGAFAGHLHQIIAWAEQQELSSIMHTDAVRQLEACSHMTSVHPCAVSILPHSQAVTEAPEVSVLGAARGESMLPSVHP